MSDLRDVFKIENCGKTQCRMSELKKGDMFEMREGEVIVFTGVARSEPTVREGRWHIEAEEMNAAPHH